MLYGYAVDIINGCMLMKNMTNFDKFAVVFLLAFALANVTWGIRNLYDIEETTAVIERLEREVVESKKNADCWERKAQEHSFGYRDRRC